MNDLASVNARPNTALLVIDVQVDVVANGHRRDEVIANIGSLVDQARQNNVAVVWVQHNEASFPKDTPGWQLAPELQPSDGEPVVHKSFGDSFEATNLEDTLSNADVGTVFVTGAQTEFCVRSTMHGAFARGYDTVLVGDAHTCDDLSEHGLPKPAEVIAHTNMYWHHQAAPGREASVLNTTEVTF